MITFSANIRSASATTDDAITTSSVGIPVTLDLSADFDGLAKTLCFKTPSAAVDIALVGDATESTVPPDVLINSGEWLHIGIYAADANGDIVIPTVWANAGVIQLGTLPSGVDPSAPTPSWVAQVQQMAGDALNNSAQAIDTANEAKEVAITAQDSAQASASAAAGSAAAAAESASTAGQRALIAQSSAAQAADSATAAAGSAALAAAKAADAGEAVDAAEHSAAAAAQYATNAETAATTAGGSAQAAQSAQTAAAGSASTASTKAGEAAQSASQAGNSASAASASATAAQSAQTAAETAQTAAEAAQSAAETAQSAAEQAADDAAEYADRLINVYPTDTASGSIATFSDGADDVPVKSLVVNIEPAQDLHGYDNPWPAGGGKNLNPGAKYDITIFTARSDGTVLANGTATAIKNYYFLNSAVSKENAIKLPAGTYTASYTVISGTLTTLGGFGFFYWEGASETRQVAQASLTAAQVSHTFSDDAYIFPVIYLTNDAVANNAVIGFQIESGSSKTSYVPYSNICPITGFDSVNIWVQPTHDTTAEPTATIQLGETVYGGSLDVVNGKMTVDRVGITPTIDRLQSINTYGIANFRFSLSDASTKAADLAKAICSALKYQSTLIADTTEPGFILSTESTGYLRIPQEIANTIETAQSWVSTNNVIVVYYLATPFELTLTPEQISTLQGTNNIWADAGDVDVTYRADVQLYIGKKTAQTLTHAASMLSNVETDMTATRAYAVNDFLSVNGQLYRVTAAIANGATITPGTNVTETTVGAQITALLNA